MSADVTVVVPTHDRRDLVLETVAAILASQDVAPAVVVVDDGSTDGTGAALARTFGDRVRVERQDPAGGAAAARNAGLATVTTRWVAFCDDDDLWAPTKLARQLAALEASPGARWCVTGAACIDESGAVIECQRLVVPDDLVAALLRRNVLPGGGSAVLAETALVREVGGFDTTQRNSEDWDLWIRLAVESPLVVVDEPLVAYRIWAGGKSRKADRMAAAFDAIAARYAELAAERGVQPDKAGHQRFLAKQQLRAGDRWGAARRFAAIGQWGRAAAALAAPRTMDRIGSARQRASLPPDWVAAADAWLHDPGHPVEPDLTRPRAEYR